MRSGSVSVAPFGRTMRMRVVPVGPTGHVVSSTSAGRSATGRACRSVRPWWAAAGLSDHVGGAPARPSMNFCVAGSSGSGAPGAERWDA
jgi:hypothetical protein